MKPTCERCDQSGILIAAYDRRGRHLVCERCWREKYTLVDWYETPKDAWEEKQG